MDLDRSSDNRAANTAPVDPAPTMMVSYMDESCRDAMERGTLIFLLKPLEGFRLPFGFDARDARVVVSERRTEVASVRGPRGCVVHPRLRFQAAQAAARLQSATLRRPSRRSLRSKPFVRYANEIPVAGSAQPS